MGKPYSNPICKGDYALGTACGNCRRCEDQQRIQALRAPSQDVIAEVAAERFRQVEDEGWTLEHDDGHANGELADAAACYAHDAGITGRNRYRPMSFWPWAIEWWKPTDRRRDLIKAAALIVAEIERLDRAALSRARTGSACTGGPNGSPIAGCEGGRKPVTGCRCSGARTGSEAQK